MKRDTKGLARLRRILANEFTGQQCWAACDIPTRERIERLTYRIMRVTEPKVVEI